LTGRPGIRIGAALAAFDRPGAPRAPSSDVFIKDFVPPFTARAPALMGDPAASSAIRERGEPACVCSSLTPAPAPSAARPLGFLGIKKIL
jgi:hypothetical protein